MANTLKFGAGQWATKEGSTLAYNDENDNYKPLPFDFTRASNATVVNKAGLIETVGNGQPRIDFLGNTQGALLLEPQRTNLIAYSSDFSNSYWSKSGASVTSGFASPSADSPLGAFKLVATTNDPYIYKTGLNVTANTQTASIYVKGVGSSIGKEGRFLFWYIGTAGGTTLSVPFTLTSDWQRVQGSTTPTSGGTIVLRIDLPDVSVVGEEVLIYGAQLEQGSYSTSYIPTQGSAVTRLADSCSQTTPDGVIGQTEGSIFIELDVNSRVLSSSWAFSLNDGTTSNHIGLRRSGGTEFFVSINVSGTTTALIATGITSGKNKISIGYASNDIIVYVNGVNVGTDTSSSIPTTSDLQIGNLISNRTLEDSVSGFKLYNTRLSNSELAALTQV